MVTAAKPAAASAGAIHIAPAGSTLPTSATATLDAAFKDLGYISEDGVTRTLSPESESIKDWGGANVLTTSTGKTEQFKFSMLDADNIEAMKLVYTSVSQDSLSGDISATNGADNRANHAFVIDMILESSKVMRIVIPKGKVDSIDDIVYVNNDAVKYGVTITAQADSSGNTSYDYIH